MPTAMICGDFISYFEFVIYADDITGAPNENKVQNHLNIALLNVFWYLNGRYRHTFIP